MTVTTRPHSQTSTIVLNLIGLDPENTDHDIHSGRDIVFPSRITITYNQHPTAPIPMSTHVVVTGNFRAPDGTFSRLRNHVEVAHPQRPEWITQLVIENRPHWWER